MGKSGVVYAATAPDGKVYRLEPSKTDEKKWSASTYFDPGSKYIWDIILDNAGTLYIATGDHGEIYKVSANGQHSLFFKSDEVHIRALALDSKGNLIAGSDGSGLVYRMPRTAKPLCSIARPKKEITALAIDKAGNIYAAAAGEKRPGGASTATQTSIIIAAPAAAQPGPAVISPSPRRQPSRHCRFRRPDQAPLAVPRFIALLPTALLHVSGLLAKISSTLSLSISMVVFSLAPAIAATYSPSTASTISRI